ncbi:MAG: aconitase X catalytic domain-containing protein [Candidatus Saliniplasma sp.]
MHLTKEEEKILEGEEGPGPAKAMELLLAIGKIYDAEKLIPIKSAQVAGVSYKTMGDAGLEFVEDFSNMAKVKVRTLMNPAGMDLGQKGIEGEHFREKQLRLVEAYSSMGIEPSCTCTPYLAGNRPNKDTHLAWSESSAVSFANTVLGARTNREGGPSALMAAVIGKTPYYGLHIKENRSPDIVYEVEDHVPMALLGYLVGEELGNKIPYFRNISPSEDELKSLGAAMAATGAVALYHVENITPEHDDFTVNNLETITVTKKDIEDVRDQLTQDNDPDVIVLGCPHLSSKELKKVAKELKNKSIKDGPDLLLYTSRKVKEDNQKTVKIIEEKGGKVITDTCMVVSPLENEYSTAATNSGKAAAYLPKLAHQNVIYADLKTLMEMIS